MQITQRKIITSQYIHTPSEAILIYVKLRTDFCDSRIFLKRILTCQFIMLIRKEKQWEKDRNQLPPLMTDALNLYLTESSKSPSGEFLLWHSGLRTECCSAAMWVQSLAWLSGLI